MRYSLIAAFALFLVWTAPAMAERIGNGGLSYTTMGGRKGETPQHMKYQAFRSDEDIANEEADVEKQKQEEEAADRVWRKYKALAAGTYTDEPEEQAEKGNKEEPAEKKDASAPQQQAQPQPAPETGLAGIISEYRKNKIQRSQMRTIVVTPPKKEEPKKEEAPAAKTEQATEQKEKPEG